MGNPSSIPALINFPNLLYEWSLSIESGVFLELTRGGSKIKTNKSKFLTSDKKCAPNINKAAFIIQTIYFAFNSYMIFINLGFPKMPLSVQVFNLIL